MYTCIRTHKHRHTQTHRHTHTNTCTYNTDTFNECLSQCISIEHVLCYIRTVFNLPLNITFPIERRYMTIPSDHQSTDMLYGCPDSISGAAI